jgi:hypothetical protein
MSAPEGGSKRLSPGEVFAYTFLGGLGAGLGIYFLLFFFGMGVVAVGQAKRQFPEVVLGIIFLSLLVAFIAAGRQKAKEAAH